MRAGYVDLPDGWWRGGAKGLGPFVTREEFHRVDGAVMVWESRWHRKHPGGISSGSTWWAPHALGWWIAVLFAIGSACFGVAAFPPFAIAVGTNADNLTYFIGSIFFTVAAFLLYVETASTDSHLYPAHRRGMRFLFRVQHRRIDWWSAIIQLLGTLWFNRTTLERAPRRLGPQCQSSPGMATGCPRIGLFPDFELVGMGRRVPWALRLAPDRYLVGNHRAQPGRVSGVRDFSHRLLRQAQWSDRQPGHYQPGYVRRSTVLFGRGCFAPAGADGDLPRSSGCRADLIHRPLKPRARCRTVAPARCRAEAPGPHAGPKPRAPCRGRAGTCTDRESRPLPQGPLSGACT